MSRETISSLQAIQAMLTAGHRSIRLKSHTLILWGLAGGILCLTIDYLITPERFPENWVRNLALLFMLSVVLSGVALADYGLTHRQLQERDESLSFVQAQITKVWWLLIGMGVLFSFAASASGAAAMMVFGVWLLLVGLGLYVHGLFSDQMLEWAGALVIALGVGSLLLHPGYLASKWLTAATFGVGMPALSVILDRAAARNASARLMQLVLWLLLILAVTVLGCAVIERTRAPQELSAQERVLSYPAGTVIPLKVRMRSTSLHVAQDAELPMTLLRPIEVSLTDGKPDRRFRLQGEEWKRFPYDLHIKVDGFSAELMSGQPPAIVVDMHVDARP